MGQSVKKALPESDAASEFWAFLGSIPLVVDSKSRVTIPSRWRRPGLGLFYAFPHPKDPTLRLMPPEYWREVQQRIDESPELSHGEKSRTKGRVFGNFVTCPMDPQGRVLLPRDIPERFRAPGDVVLQGDSEKISLWRAEDWRLRQEQDKEQLIEDAERYGL